LSRTGNGEHYEELGGKPTRTAGRAASEDAEAARQLLISSGAQQRSTENQEQTPRL
jgi:hypothetical protein